MPQIFHRSTNTLARLSIFGGLFILGFAAWALAEINRSSWNTGAYVEREQPVQFSHKHHVGDDGIDCRYCHTSVETSNSAGLPPTKTCMNCHSQIYSDSPYLEPVRASWKTNKPIEWTRVHDLPDYVYFNHSIHVNKGVGCSTCHGRVDEMPLVYQFASLQMEWCLQCHREPERFIRPRDQVFNMKWQAGNAGAENKTDEQLKQGRELVKKYNVRHKAILQSCSTCHR
jgi:ribonucleotide reductase alpha subunit